VSGTLLLIRILFVIITASTAYQISLAMSATPPFSMVNIISIVLGALFAVFVIWIELKYAVRFIVGVFTVILGLLIGFIASYLFIQGLSLIPHIRILRHSIPPTILNTIQEALEVCVTFFFCYMAVAIQFRTQHRFKLLIPFIDLTKEQFERALILDTSVIIDGRIITLCENNILRGTLVVPKFVLNELQTIADSSDKRKRMRGRRGLEMLAELQKKNSLKIRIDSELLPQIIGVDEKLIALAQNMQGILVTNDYNLKKVAELHHIEVINLNVVANSLRLPVLPGDTLNVQIIREGEEYTQGIGYLEDGTVVVVENGRHLIGKNAEVAITNVLQTNVGRMVFGKLHEK
jgi:uncharacterized protein YacL